MKKYKLENKLKIRPRPRRLECNESDLNNLLKGHKYLFCLLLAFNNIFPAYSSPKDFTLKPKQVGKRCREYICMNDNQFLYLVGLMSPDLQKRDTKMRDCISVEELTCLVLRFLPTGETYRSLEFHFRISRSRISKAVIEVSKAIKKSLGGYLKTPNKLETKWLQISRKFEQIWNFPNGIGAIDGKHIVMKQPDDSGSHYRNYKGTDSIVLMSMVGSEYEFLYVCIFHLFVF